MSSLCSIYLERYLRTEMNDQGFEPIEQSIRHNKIKHFFILKSIK
jgi:hypothetical protein